MALPLISLECDNYFFKGLCHSNHIFRQRNYSEKEDNAAKVRQKIDEQMGNIHTESLSSDPDEHLEM